MSDFQILSMDQCDDSEYKPINEIKSYKGSNRVYQKNYPKNILISMLDYLVSNGYKCLLQKLPFSRKEIQTKNSASLDDIFDSLELLKMNQIDKKHCLKCCSNLILQNSKVSKKRFHLQILNVILSFSDDIQRGQFKVLMSQYSRSISQKKSQNIQMFNYQSSTIYFLSVFLGLISQYKYLNVDNFRYRWRTQQQISDQQIRIHYCSAPLKLKKKSKTRELLKPLANQLKLTLNRESYDQFKFQNISKFINTIIDQAEKKIKEALSLTFGIPKLITFYIKVVEQCFNCLERRQKITAKILRKFIKQFQNGTFQFTQVIKQNQENQILSNSNIIEKQHIDFQSQPSIFCPYLIVAPP